jgi:hypothetical protein
MIETIKVLKQETELIQEKIETKTFEGRNLLQGSEQATVDSSPTAYELEVAYYKNIKAIFMLNQAKKEILKGIKFLERLEK